MTCSVGDCDRPAARDGRCWAHVKRAQRDQPITGEIARRPASALERLTEAAIAYAEAEGDEEWERARDNLRKSAAAYARKGLSEAVRSAMARLKAEGRHIGRPRKLRPEEALRLVSELGGTRQVAVVMQVSVRTVRRAVAQAKRKQGDPFVLSTGPGPQAE